MASNVQRTGCEHKHNWLALAKFALMSFLFFSAQRESCTSFLFNVQELPGWAGSYATCAACAWAGPHLKRWIWNRNRPGYWCSVDFHNPSMVLRVHSVAAKFDKGAEIDRNPALLIHLWQLRFECNLAAIHPVNLKVTILHLLSACNPKWGRVKLDLIETSDSPRFKRIATH